MPPTPFGPFAERYATRLPHQLDVLVFDEYRFGEALENAFERALSWGPFLASPIIADRRSKVAIEATGDIMNTRSEYWKRRECFDLVRAGGYLLAGKSQPDHEALSNKERDSLRDVLLTSDGVMVRSWTELMRLSTLLDYRSIRAFRAVAPARIRVPAFRPRRGAKTILVWAPELDALQASMFAFALEELKAPVVVACSDASSGAGLGLRARFINCTDRAAIEPLLDEVAAIIDGTPEDPASAVDFAGLGLPLAASFCSGAYEYVDGAYAYDVWDYSSIFHAALAALGGEPPRVRGATPRPVGLVDDPPQLGPPELEDPPLVSVVMPTLNRHGVLPRAINSLARQTYANVEVIVVNDGGTSVDAIVEPLPHVRVINTARPEGALAAVRAGIEQAQGTYLVLLADDDYLFPTHISRLVYALERTGTTVAVAMCAESYLQPGENSYYDFIGTSIRLYRSTDPTILRTIPTSIAISAMVVRLDAARSIGDLDPKAQIYADYEWHLRFLEHYDFLWVTHLLTNMDSRLDNSNMSGQDTAQDRAAILRSVWSHYVSPARPDIERARNAYLELLAGAPAHRHPLNRGVTRVAQLKRSVYRLGTTFDAATANVGKTGN